MKLDYNTLTEGQGIWITKTYGAEYVKFISKHPVYSTIVYVLDAQGNRKEVQIFVDHGIGFAYDNKLEALQIRQFYAEKIFAETYNKIQVEIDALEAENATSL